MMGNRSVQKVLALCLSMLLVSSLAFAMGGGGGGGSMGGGNSGGSMGGGNNSSSNGGSMSSTGSMASMTNPASPSDMRSSTQMTYGQKDSAVKGPTGPNRSSNNRDLHGRDYDR